MNKRLRNDEVSKKINALDEKISKVRNEYEETQKKHMGDPIEDESPEVVKGRLTASMFLGNVLAGLLIGLLIDKFLGFAPWGLMFCTILGFVGGVYRAQDLLQKK